MPQDPVPQSNNHETLWRLTYEDIQEFKRLIKETTGHELTDQEAWNRSTELVALYRMLLGCIPEDPAHHSSGPEPPPEPGGIILNHP